MKVYYLTGKQQVGLREEPLPTLGPTEVLIKTRVSALSVGTEVWRYLNHGHYGGEGGKCGYNSVGEIVRVGSDVSRLQVGDLVFAVHPHSEFFAVPQNQAVKLAPDADLEASAFTYLPTLGLHAMRYSDYQAGDNVLVVGLGIVGMLAAQVARVVGARVASLEIDAARRELAQRLDFDMVLDPRQPTTAQRLDDFFGEPGPDVILETSQAWQGLIDAVRLARASTRLAIVGIYRFDPPPEVARELLSLTFMNRDHFHNQRLKVIGCSNDPREDYPPGIVRWTIQRNMEYIAERIDKGDLNTRMAITHRFRWDELEQVYRRFVDGDRSMVGVVMHWDD